MIKKVARSLQGVMKHQGGEGERPEEGSRANGGSPPSRRLQMEKKKKVGNRHRGGGRKKESRGEKRPMDYGKLKEEKKSIYSFRTCSLDNEEWSVSTVVMCGKTELDMSNRMHDLLSSKGVRKAHPRQSARLEKGQKRGPKGKE